MGLFVHFIFPFFLLAGEKTELPKKYKTWIEEEVVYIITSKEREVFYKLETDRERDMFIEEFWRQRDPTPGTFINEFKDEHYRRIEYANKEFKKYSSIAGWRTDMGKIYIALGEPIQRMKYNRSEAYPMEIWYYYGNPKFGQAPVFRLLFFRRFGVGPFELYDPIADGPKSLTPLSSMRLPSQGIQGVPSEWMNKVKDPQDLAAYEILRDEVGFEVADAAFSSFPGGYGPDYMLPSSILAREVQIYPQKKVEDDYAYEFLEHKAVVEVDYSVNHINSLSRIQVLEDQPGLFFVNYSIEPEAFSVDYYQNKYQTNIKTSVRVTDPGGKTIVQHSKNFPIELEKKLFRDIGQRPFHLQDSFPLVTGNYRFSLLWENMVSKEFTTAELDISVPDPDFLRMSPLILARKINIDETQIDINKAFQIGGFQIYPSLHKRFYQKGKLHVFFQIYGLDEGLKREGILEYAFFKEEKKLPLLAKKISEYENQRDFVEEFPLENIYPGRYRIIVRLLDAKGEMMSASDEFSVTKTAFPEPWVVTQPNPPSGDPVYRYITGNQFMNKGDVERAREHLEIAWKDRPDSLDFAISYSRSLLVLKEFQRVKDILLPFMKAKKENFTLYYYLGRSSKSVAEYDEAISYYQQALSHKGNVVEILNSIGDCYFELGNKDQALRAWEKSLEANPNQERIRNRVEELKEK